jgi:hypothetical protein
MSSTLDEMIEKLTGLPDKARDEVISQAAEATKDMRWVPNPGPQTVAYFTEADELFYGGQAGGGKTDLILGLALNEHKNSLILRRTNKEAEKLPERMEEIVGHTDGLNRSTGTWKLEGKVLDMGGCQLETDKQKRKGIPHDLKAFDEVSDFTESQYTFICAWNRSADPKQRCRVVATGNPPTTAEGYWVIKRWAAWLDPTHPNPADDGELRWYTTSEEGKDIEVDGPGPHLINGEEVIARSRTFIRAKLSDNPDLAATNYDAVLASLPERERLAYRDGRFDMSIQDELGQAIPTSWVRLAQERWTQQPPFGVPMCAMGVDMSGGGKDPMIIAPRYDGWFAPIIEIPAKEFDVTRLSQQAAGYILTERRDKALVIIDLGGGYGSGTFEHLKQNEIDTYGYKGSEKVNMRAKDSNIPFRNKRTAAIWRMREALDPSQPGGSKIMLPEDSEMVADLTAPTYKIINNKIIVESKEDVCKRLGRSTDKGDAVEMAWFQGAKECNSALEWIDNQQSRRGFAKVINSGRQPLTARRRA